MISKKKGNKISSSINSILKRFKSKRLKFHSRNPWIMMLSNSQRSLSIISMCQVLIMINRLYLGITFRPWPNNGPQLFPNSLTYQLVCLWFYFRKNNRRRHVAYLPSLFRRSIHWSNSPWINQKLYKLSGLYKRIVKPNQITCVYAWYEKIKPKNEWITEIMFARSCC